MVTLLSRDELDTRLQDLDGWQINTDARALEQTFQFADFRSAFGFMTQVALAAEKLDHHPDWRNVYNTVEIHLSTHEAGGITQRDFDLAAAISAALAI